MIRLWSTSLALAGLAVFCGSVTAATENENGFGYEQIVEKAEARAAEPYEPPKTIPEFLRELGFVGLDQISFRADKALWGSPEIPFEARFYHPGSFFVHPVTVHVVNEQGVERLPFSRDAFAYPNDDMRAKVPEELGYAGVKILHELNSTEYLDEIVSFLGASYFRALPADSHYGLSARGLAIDTASADGEEFPAFTAFWLVEPDEGAETLTLYALLDSPSVAGAYKIVIDPGETTTTRVESTLFTRNPIAKIGIAPLTSMFGWGENSLHRLDDYRPEAHDSDGLLIATSAGEWLWRPLKNPQVLTINRFSADNVEGLGLLQRDRNFANYQDLAYEYERRPSAWITPEGDWGEGVVELVQIPSDSEVNDNVVAYWVPEDPVEAGETLHYAYNIAWSTADPSPDTHSTAQATRIGYAAIVPGQPKNRIQVAIEFTGGQLGEITDATQVEPRVSAMRDVTLSNIQAVRNPHTNGWRLTFLVPTSALENPLELRAFLAGSDGGALTETWSYTLTP